MRTNIVKKSFHCLRRIVFKSGIVRLKVVGHEQIGLITLAN